jgi:hypothetical protein
MLVGCANSVGPRNRTICSAIEFTHPTAFMMARPALATSLDFQHPESRPGSASLWAWRLLPSQLRSPSAATQIATT